MEADSLSSRQRVNGLRQAGLVSASRVLLDHAFLHGFIDQTEGCWDNRFGVCWFSGFNRGPQLLHLCF